MRQAIEGKILARIEDIEILIGAEVKFHSRILAPEHQHSMRIFQNVENPIYYSIGENPYFDFGRKSISARYSLLHMILDKPIFAS